jgi:hypothetical protein
MAMRHFHRSALALLLARGPLLVGSACAALVGSACAAPEAAHAPAAASATVACGAPGTSCDDGNACTLEDKCTAKGCAGTVPPELCGSGLDDDCDGLVDAHDLDCNPK